MSRRTSPGFAEWVFVTLTIVGFIFLLYQLYQYGSVRQLFPVGLEVAGIDVGGLTREEAENLVSERYLDAPVVLYHREQPIEIFPNRAEFSLNFETMMIGAMNERDQQDFWAGFWGFLWGRPVDVSPVPLSANHSEDALRETLRIVAEQFDQPALPPQPVSGSMSFQYGAPGVQTNIDASLENVTAAFYRHRAREAQLTLEAVESERPDITLLSSLITNSLQEFESRSGGVGSVFIIDLTSGYEIGYNAGVPMTGMNVLNIPIMVEALRVLPAELSAEQRTLLESAAIATDNTSANTLLTVIAGTEDGYLGATLLTEGMSRIGLDNTFVACPFDVDGRRCELVETEANTILNTAIAPDPYYQTTAEDVGLLLAMLYYCAEQGGGTLAAIYPDVMTPERCQIALDYLAQNKIGSLIEEGVPSEATVAHRHGWQSDTYADAGIVYSEGGDYVIVQFMHKPGWLAWEISSPMMADLSRAAYNFFNFDNPYLTE